MSSTERTKCIEGMSLLRDEIGVGDRVCTLTLKSDARYQDRAVTAQAMTLFLKVETELREARAAWNQDRFRRLMRLRRRVITRLRRRWTKLDPTPSIPLGRLTRRCHANLAQSLNPQASPLGAF